MNRLILATLAVLAAAALAACNGALGVDTAEGVIYFSSQDMVRMRWPVGDNRLERAVQWRTEAKGVRVGRVTLTRRYGMTGFTLVLVSVDASRVRAEVRYSKDHQVCSDLVDPKGPHLCVNGSLFSSKPLGLLVHGGQVVNPRHPFMAGYLVVPKGGRPTVKIGEAFALDEVAEALQSFPALLRHGQVVPQVRNRAPDSPFQSDVAARRTVVGEDGRGNLLFAVTDTLTGGLSFNETATLLAALGWKDALCLDGGGSSQLSLRLKNARLDVPGMDPVPVKVALWLKK